MLRRRSRELRDLKYAVGLAAVLGESPVLRGIFWSVICLMVAGFIWIGKPWLKLGLGAPDVSCTSTVPEISSPTCKWDFDSSSAEGHWRSTTRPALLLVTLEGGHQRLAETSCEDEHSLGHGRLGRPVDLRCDFSSDAKVRFSREVPRLSTWSDVDRVKFTALGVPRIETSLPAASEIRVRDLRMGFRTLEGKVDREKGGKYTPIGRYSLGLVDGERRVLFSAECLDTGSTLGDPQPGECIADYDKFVFRLPPNVSWTHVVSVAFSALRAPKG